MTQPKTGDVTQLLLDWHRGDQGALTKLIPLVYDELRRIARRQLRRVDSGGQIQTTTLVHEAYCKLVNQSLVGWRNRAHFYAIAANTMRRILVDEYRRRVAEKRGGGGTHVTLSEAYATSIPVNPDLIALNDALEELVILDQRQAKLIEMRFFGGMTNDEIAEAMGISVATVKREWRAAKAWLHSRLQ